MPDDWFQQPITETLQAYLDYLCLHGLLHAGGVPYGGVRWHPLRRRWLEREVGLAWRRYEELRGAEHQDRVRPARGSRK